MGRNAILATRLGLLGCLVAFLVVLVSSSATHAQDSRTGLTLSPLRTELTIQPGTTQKSELNLSNSTDAPMIVNLTSEIFSVINPDYDYSFSIDSEVAQWVQFSKTTIELQPDESQKVIYDIAVPIGTEPGGRYISIFASTDSDKDQKSIMSRQRIASLLYITVDGKVTRDGDMLSLTAPWWVGGPTSWSATIQNKGTAHFRSRYIVDVKTLFGNESVAQATGEALILPATVRRVTEPLTIPQIPGIYQVTYTIGLGDQPARVETRLIVYIPIWLWFAVGLVALAAVGFVLRHRRRD